MAAASTVGEARAAVLCDDPGVGEIAVSDGRSRRCHYLLSEYERVLVEPWAWPGSRCRRGKRPCGMWCSTCHSIGASDHD